MTDWMERVAEEFPREVVVARVRKIETELAYLRDACLLYDMACAFSGASDGGNEDA